MTITFKIDLAEIVRIYIYVGNIWEIFVNAVKEEKC